MVDLSSRVINLSPYKPISITQKTLHHTLVDEATIIIEYGDDYFVIQDDIEKIKDVSQMPNYIKEDWIKYNRKELTNQILDWHIYHYTELFESNYPPDKEVEDTLSLLKSIKRHQIIKKII